MAQTFLYPYFVTKYVKTRQAVEVTEEKIY